jgi:NAD(P)-dependent dehydrogenase (short-subunit alcohol dehydrogenase family)
VSAQGRNPGLAGQTVVVIGGSSGIGLETARSARAEGADVILTARDPDRLRVGLVVIKWSAALDAEIPASMECRAKRSEGRIMDLIEIAGGDDLHAGSIRGTKMEL